MQGTRARLRLTVLSLCVLGWILDAKQPLQAQEGGVSASEILIGGIGALTGPFAFIGAPGRDGLHEGVVITGIERKRGLEVLQRTRDVEDRAIAITLRDLLRRGLSARHRRGGENQRNGVRRTMHHRTLRMAVECSHDA